MSVSHIGLCGGNVTGNTQLAYSHQLSEKVRSKAPLCLPPQVIRAEARLSSSTKGCLLPCRVGGVAGTVSAAQFV